MLSITIMYIEDISAQSVYAKLSDESRGKALKVYLHLFLSQLT